MSPVSLLFYTKTLETMETCTQCLQCLQCPLFFVFKEHGHKFAIVYRSLALKCEFSVCDRIKNYDRTGLGSFWPEPDRITSQKMLTGYDRICRIDRIGRIFTGLLNFNTQLTSHKHKYGSFNVEI